MKVVLSRAIIVAFFVVHVYSENTKLKDLFAWKTIDYAWNKPEDRAAAIEKGEFIPINNLPLGLEVWKDKLFITVPRWKSGVVSTLNYVKLNVDDLCEPPPTESATTAPPPTDPTTDPTTDPLTDPATDPTDADAVFPPFTDPDTPPPFAIDEIAATTLATPTIPPDTTPAVTDPPVTILGRVRLRSMRGKEVEDNGEEEVKKNKKNKKKKGENEAEKVKKPKKDSEKVKPEVKPEKKPKKDKKDKKNGKEKKKKKKKCKDDCKDDFKDDCKNDCKDDCKDDYKDDCKDDYKDDCKNDCKDDCKEDCDDDPTPAPTTPAATDDTTVTPDSCEPRSPALIPYPSFEANRINPENKDGSAITSVFRVKADACDRLWVMDTGVADILGETVVASKPRILIYNLNDDTLIRSYDLKDSDSKAESFYANIVVDADPSNCDKAFAYVPDLGGYGIVVYDYEKNESWRIKHNYFHFDPLKGNMTVGGVNFQWTDGVFSIALTKPKEDGSRTAYFHALASTKEFKVDTKTLQTKDTDKISFFDFHLVGDRGEDSQSSASYIQEDSGVMFYTQLQRDGVYCWNTNKPLVDENLVEVARDNETMIFTNDLKVDAKGRLWVLTDRLPTFIYKGLGEDEVNYHIFSGAVDEIIAGTNCAP